MKAKRDKEAEGDVPLIASKLRRMDKALNVSVIRLTRIRGNQLTDSTSGPGSHQPSVTLSSGYDAYHDRTSLTDNITGNVGVTTFQYDPAFRLTNISASYNGSAGPQVVLGYDPGNRLTSIDRTIGGSGTSVNTSIVYDPANRVGTITDQTGTGTALSTYVYGYDTANRVTTEVNAEGTVTYGYDCGGELLTARGSRTENYSYDSGGNRNMTGYTTGTGNELKSGGGYTFTYDKEGNTIGETQLSTHDVWTFGYDDRNRMTSAVEKNSGGTTLEQVTYTYDALDHRIGVDTNGTQMWTVYDGQGADANPYADFNSSGTLLTRYVSGPGINDIFARTSSGGTTAWYLGDRLGSVRDIVNTSGTSIDHVVYDSYGTILSESSGGTNGDRFKFAGMEWDAAIGQYYDHARWYGVGTGRFLQRDAIGFAGRDTNLYRYVFNAPTDTFDRSGHIQENGQEGEQAGGQASTSTYYQILRYTYDIAIAEMEEADEGAEQADQGLAQEEQQEDLYKQERTRLNTETKDFGKDNAARLAELRHLIEISRFNQREYARALLEEEATADQAYVRAQILVISASLPIF